MSSNNFNIGWSVDQLQNETENSTQTKADSIITISHLEQIKKESILWSIFFAIITWIGSSVIFEIWVKHWFGL